MASENEKKSNVRTLLWSSNDGETPLDENYDYMDMSVKALKSIEKTIDDFWSACEKHDIDDFDGQDSISNDGDPCGSIMHDLCLTVYRHGAGFWDGDYPTNGDKLTDICHGLGVDDTSGAYIGDDNKIYIA